MLRNLDPESLGLWGHESEIIELALTYGYESIDLNITEFASKAQNKGFDYAKRFIASANIPLGCFRLPIEWDVEDSQFKESLEKLEQLAELASKVGCKRCIATVQPAGDKRPYHENFEFHRFRFADICDVLAKYEIQFGIGFRASPNLRQSQAFQFIHDFDALSLLVKVVDRPNIGFVLDTWELHVSKTSMDDVRKLAAGRIVRVDLADFPSDKQVEEADESMRLLPGATGVVDNVGYLKMLQELGYDGPVSPKPDRKAIGTTRREQLMKITTEAFMKVWEEAGLPTERKLVTPLGKKL